MSESRTQVGSIEIAWDEHGGGDPPFVLVHGFTGARTDFAAHLEPLARERRVIAADHRGHGDSTNTAEEATYTLETLTEDLAGFLDQEVGTPSDLLGHSMGGMVALRLALARPDLVRSLILMDTAAESLDVPLRPDALAPLVREHGVRKIVEVGAAGTPERELLIECKGADWVAADAEHRLSRLDPAAFLGLLEEVFSGPNLLADVRRIRVPTTVLVGSLDGPFVGPAERLAEAIEGARLEVIEGAYHSPQHSHPEPWRERVQAHLDRVGAGAARV